MRICMYGASSDDIAEIYMEKAREFGRMLAENKHTLVYGGGKFGIMGAAARSALANGGNVIGIAPCFFKKNELLNNCSEFFYTQTMCERKRLMENKSDVFVVMPGGIGTLEEFFEILSLKQLMQHNKPIVVANINEYFELLLAMLQKAKDEKFLSEEHLQLFSVCRSVDEIFKLLK